MTITNKNVQEIYDGDGTNTVFAIPFDYQKGRADQVTKVTNIASDGTETLLTLNTHYQLTPAGDEPSNVDTSLGSSPFGPPAADAQLKVSRESEKIQQTDFDSAGPATPYNPTAVENAFDKLTRIVQELDLSVGEVKEIKESIEVISGTILADWVGEKEYKLNQLVFFNFNLYRATVSHESGGSFLVDFDEGKWEIVRPRGLEGPAGPAGIAGPTGATGATGPAGADGVDGDDGVFAEIATQAEAEAGVDNTKGITPLRAKQAIDEQVPPFLTDLEDFQVEANKDIAELKVAVSNLESFAEFAVGKFSGSQKLLNNQTTPIELLGKFIPEFGDGRGGPLNRSSAGSQFAKVYIQISRRKGSGLENVRFSSFDLIMHFVDGQWYIGREGTTQLVYELELDGVTLSVNTDAGVGQVSYTTDNMTGPESDTFHFENSEIKWWGQEIPSGV